MMKKLLFVFGVAAAISLSAQSKVEDKVSSNLQNSLSESKSPVQPPDFWDKFGYSLLFYFPNRTLDLGDVLTLNTSLGMGFLYFRVTDYLQLGADCGEKYFTKQVFHRKYPENFRPSYMEFSKYFSKNMPFGAGHYSGYRAGFLCFATSDESTNECSGKVKSYKYESDGIPSFNDAVYKEKIKDFWALETSVCCTGWGIDLEMHPVELLDFAAGIFLIDLSDDDLGGTAILRVE